MRNRERRVVELLNEAEKYPIERALLITLTEILVLLELLNGDLND